MLETPAPRHALRAWHAEPSPRTGADLAVRAALGWYLASNPEQFDFATPWAGGIFGGARRGGLQMRRLVGDLLRRRRPTRPPKHRGRGAWRPENRGERCRCCSAATIPSAVSAKFAAYSDTREISMGVQIDAAHRLAATRLKGVREGFFSTMRRASEMAPDRSNRSNRRIAVPAAPAKPSSTTPGPGAPSSIPPARSTPKASPAARRPGARIGRPGDPLHRRRRHLTLP